MLLPSRLITLFLFDNVLNGTIPTSLPNTLYELAINNNYLKGTIPTMPSGLNMLHVSGNYLSGDASTLSPTMRDLMLGSVGSNPNQFTGTLRLNNPYQLEINDNWITDIIIQDSSGLTICDLSNNPLLGNLNIAGLTMCTKNGLYSASLLPNTKITTSLSKTTTQKVVSTSKVGSTSIVRTASSSTKLATTKVTVEIKTTPLETLDGLETVITTEYMSNFLGPRKTVGMTTPLTSKMSTKKTIAIILKRTTKAGTVQFVQEMSGFSLNAFILLRLTINALLLIFVMIRTPFGREFKRIFKLKSRKSDRPEF